VGWKDISLAHDSLGKPLANLTGGAKARYDELGAQTLCVSLSDEDGYVVAYAHLS